MVVAIVAVLGYPIVNLVELSLQQYGLFQLISHDPAGQQDISDPKVQQRIRQGLMQVRSQLLQGAYFEMLRDQAKVENFFAETIFKSDAK